MKTTASLRQHRRPSGDPQDNWSRANSAYRLCARYYSSNPNADQIIGNAIRLYSLPQKVYLVVRGSNNGIYYRNYDLTTETWNSWASAPGSTADPPAAAVLGKNLHMAVRGVTGNAIWMSKVNLNDYSYSAWQLMSGTTPSSPGLTANSIHLCLVVRGENNAIYYRFYSLATNIWGSLQVVPQGTTLSTPGVAFVGNELHLTVRGLNSNQIWHCYIDTKTNSFSGWTLLDGTTPSPPILTAANAGYYNGQYLWMIVRGDNNAIYRRPYV